MRSKTTVALSFKVFQSFTLTHILPTMFSLCFHSFTTWWDDSVSLVLFLCCDSCFFQIKGRIISYLMGLSKRPLTVFGICLSIVSSLILLTICISTILYCNAVKKSRINPESNYIKVVRRIKWETFGTCNLICNL